MGAINGLCELPELNWYKENQVEMIYTYMDETIILLQLSKFIPQSVDNYATK